MRRTYYCTVEATLDALGGKWKPLIVYHLTGRTLRYNQLRRLIPNISQRVLTLHLKELESNGLVHRHEHDQIPPKVEYSLTEYGKTLEPVMAAMCTWGGRHIEKFNLAFDPRATSAG